MQLDDFQRTAWAGAIHGHASDPTALALKLAEEAGEVAGEVFQGLVTDTRPDKGRLRGELGDVLVTLALLARAAGLTLQEVAAASLEKLAERRATQT